MTTYLFLQDGATHHRRGKLPEGFEATLQQRNEQYGASCECAGRRQRQIVVRSSDDNRENLSR